MANYGGHRHVEARSGVDDNVSDEEAELAGDGNLVADESMQRVAVSVAAFAQKRCGLRRSDGSRSGQTLGAVCKRVHPSESLV